MLEVIFFTFVGIVGFAIGRIISIVFSLLFQRQFSLDVSNAHTLIVLGSGGELRMFLLIQRLKDSILQFLGHTTEMLEIVKKLKTDKYTPRYYVVAEGDENSVNKLLQIETDKEKFKIFVIRRSRQVHQSYLSSVKTTLLSFLDCLPILIHAKPNLILTNGPGTCVPICIVAFMMKVFFYNSSCKITFIESFCRVKTLSLSGWILLYISDIFVVQWPAIKNISRKIQYFGRLT